MIQKYEQNNLKLYQKKNRNKNYNKLKNISPLVS